MPQLIQTIPDDELKTDYRDSKLDAQLIEKLGSCAVFDKKADYWRARLDTDRAIMRNIEAEARRRGLEL